MNAQLKGKNERDKNQKPLIWRVVETFSEGSVTIQLSSATTHQGKILYSFSVNRQTKSGRLTHYLHPEDIRNIEKLLSQAQMWVDADRHEQASKQKKHHPRVIR